MAFVPAPGYQPTFNPTLPYSNRIPGGLSVGMSVYIQGEVNKNKTMPVVCPAYPGPGVDPQPPVSLPSMEAPPVFNPPMPFTGRLQGGLMTRRTIIIKGFIPPSAQRFAINFKVGLTGEVALHINPRLDEGSVVRNSLQDGAWGAEERDISYNPFAPGQFFDLSIRSGTDRFKVFANGRHMFDFSHRLSAYHTVDILEITGDVTLSYVQM